MAKDVKKRHKDIFMGIVKTKSLLVLLIITALFVNGCTKQNNGLSMEQPNKEDSNTTTDPTNTPTEILESEIDNVNGTIEEEDVEIFNNGGLYVKYQGNVYYRKYTADNYAKEGLFGHYESIPGAKKNMMRIKQDGSTNIAFGDIGEGNIYIYEDRMYLQRYNQDYIPSVYSVDLDGSNEQVIGTGYIKGIDEETGTLVCILTDDKNTYQLHMVDGVTGEKSKYNLEVPCAEYLTIEDGVIYYSGDVKFESSILGEVKLCSVNIDGSNEKTLAHTKGNLYEYGDRGTVIPCIQFINDTIYYSYGTYGGTGNFYQGGKIAKVQKDGSGFKVLLGEKEGNEEINYNLVNDIFYVTSVNGKEILYFSQSSENEESLALDLSTGKIADTDFLIHGEGVPFEYENGIRIYQNASPQMITWIPYIDYSLLHLEKEADYNTINNIELCDNWVYYRLEANEKDPEASIGWREGYRRVKTTVLRQELNGEEKEILFEY